MISAATASSGREVFCIFLSDCFLRHARPCAGHPRLAECECVKRWMAGTSPAKTRQLFPTVPTHAADLDHRALRRKPRVLRRRVEAVGDRTRRGFADRAAMLADEKHHRRVRGMIADAGEKRVAALDP